MGEHKREPRREAPKRQGSAFARVWHPNVGSKIKTYDGTVYQVQETGAWKRKGKAVGVRNE